jgi:tRNA 2-thiouridine synthesizing protein A
MTHIDRGEIARHWLAGESGCGSLIVGLRNQLALLRSGELLQVTAHSVGARADLPAWCRVTGHSLVAADHPVYVLRKNGD